MSTEKLAEEAVKLMERAEEEKENISAQEITLDDSNEVSFPGYPYKFKALGEKILVSIDVFKSGYECKICKGKKRIHFECECVSCGRPGLRYSSSQITDIRNELGDTVADTRAKMQCPECYGCPKDVERDEECSACKGVGALLVLPESSTNLPTTGVVVSMGEEAKKKAEFKLGDRVLFGAYAGSMIPTKVGLMFKYMDWNQAVILITGADDLAAFDFIIKE